MEFFTSKTSTGESTKIESQNKTLAEEFKHIEYWALIDVNSWLAILSSQYSSN